MARCAPVLLGQVADDVERPVEVLQRDDLAAHRVVEPAGHVGVDQTVAHPDARADLLRLGLGSGLGLGLGFGFGFGSGLGFGFGCARLLGDLVDEIEGALDTLLADGLGALHGGGDDLLVVAEHVERILRAQADQVAALAPLDLGQA